MHSLFHETGRWVVLCGIMAATCWVGACASTEKQQTPNPEPREFPQPFNRPAAASPDDPVKPAFGTYHPAVSTVFPDYRLNVGDVLEIIYHVRTEVSIERYRLKVQDVISINFPFHSKYDQEVTVNSDGTIRLQLVGEVPVVTRGERGLGPFHFQQDKDQRWERYVPGAQDKGRWEACDFELVRMLDGRWVKRLSDGTESPLEDMVPTNENGEMLAPCIVDALLTATRRERYEYDSVQQRWKTRPIVIEQAGMTAAELQEDLRERYGRYLNKPELTVTVKQANIKIAELKIAITTAPRGQSRLIPVKPDGTLDLPFIGEVLAYGKTVQQLKVDIETAYAQVDLPEISVTVQMNEWAPQKFFVLGEVNGPGMITEMMPMTVFQAIAAAGGVNPRASDKEILIIRRKGLPVPEATIMDLRGLRNQNSRAKSGAQPDFANLRFDFFLADGDIIYVPTSGLAATGDWVDQVFGRIIRGVFPYQFYTGLNFGYELHNEPSKSKVSGNKWPNVNVGLTP